MPRILEENPPHNLTKRIGLACRWTFLALLLLLTVSGRASGEENCAISQATFDSDTYYMTHTYRLHITVMGTRYVELRRATRGLACMAPPLVAFDGLRYRPAAWAEDIGPFLVVPELVKHSGWSLEAATDIFFITTIVLASVIGLFGFLLQTQTSLGRWIGCAAFLLLTILLLRKGDQYALGATAAVALVPWILLLATRKKLTAATLVAATLIGVLAQAANYMRAHSGTGLIMFAVIIMLLVSPAPRIGRALLVVALGLGACIPILLMQHLAAQRDAFLRAHPPSVSVEAGSSTVPVQYKQPRSSDVNIPAGHHAFWSNVYSALAYIKNPEVPAYKDEESVAKVHELRPDAAYCSPEYEQVLRHEIWELTKRRPLLIVENVVAKSVVVAFVCLWAINLGLYAAWLAPKPCALEAAFWLLIAFYAAPGVAVLPLVTYLLSMVACAAIYGAYSIEYAARNPQVRWRPRWLARLARAN